jgi:virginiamycin B lyase
MTFRRLCAFFFALLVAACSGPSPSGPLTPHSAESRTNTTATIRIKIPKRHAARSKFISPSTKSIAMTFTPSKGTAIHINVNLTPADPRCSGSPLVCTLSLGLAPDLYLADFITYDGILDSHHNPTGFILSKNLAVPVTILREKHNVVSVTLGGIPAYVSFTPAPGSALVSNGSGYTASKCFSTAQSVNVIGEDIDSNMILGPGAPVPTLTSDDPAHLAVATPSPYAPNTFSLTRPSLPSPQAAVHLTAKVTAPASAGGAAAQSVITITYNSDICGVFTEYSTSVPTTPTWITAGPDGRLWFTGLSSNAIGQITTTGVVTTTTTVTTSSSAPYGIAVGNDGNLWFTEHSANKIGQISTLGAMLNEFSIPTSGSAPLLIASGPDGRLWFTEQNGNKIGRINPNTGNINDFTVVTASSQPYGIATGPDGALWFTESNGNNIGRMATNGATPTEYSIATTPGSSPTGIVTGPDQALWFTESLGNKIGRVTTNGSFTEYSISTTNASFPEVITTGPDGALWFTENAGNKIGRITTAGAITEFDIPTPLAGPYGVVTGPDHFIWFTECTANKIGRLQ